MTDPTAAFGEALRARRQHLGLSQEQVAERAASSFPVVSRLERGLWSPTLRTAARYAAALDTTIAALLTGESA